MTAKNIRLEVYREQKKKLVDYVDRKWVKHELKNYHFLSANLSKCLPYLDEEEHKTFYRKILSYRVLQGIDTHFYNMFDSVHGVHEISKIIESHKSPQIYVSYHLGSFRSVMAFLLKADKKVVLIIDPLPYQLQKDEIIEQYQKIKEHFGSSSDLIIYSADRKDLSIQILTKTKSNYSVLAFVDGNTGMNGVFNQANSVKMDFLGQHVNFRKGLAMLSYYSKCPLVPVLSHYDEQDYPHWKVLEPIVPDLSLSAQDFSSMAMTKIFKILENALKVYPEQWEGWLYLHKFLELEEPNLIKKHNLKKGTTHLEINPKVGLFAFEDKYYLINKENYIIVEVTKEIFYEMDKNIHFNISTRDPEEVQFLLERRILKTNCVVYEQV